MAGQTPFVTSSPFVAALGVKWAPASLAEDGVMNLTVGGVSLLLPAAFAKEVILVF